MAEEFPIKKPGLSFSMVQKSLKMVGINIETVLNDFKTKTAVELIEKLETYRKSFPKAKEGNSVVFQLAVIKGKVLCVPVEYEYIERDGKQLPLLIREFDPIDLNEKADSFLDSLLER